MNNLTDIEQEAREWYKEPQVFTTTPRMLAAFHKHMLSKPSDPEVSDEQLDSWTAKWIASQGSDFPSQWFGAGTSLLTFLRDRGLLSPPKGELTVENVMEAVRGSRRSIVDGARHVWDTVDMDFLREELVALSSGEQQEPELLRTGWMVDGAVNNEGFARLTFTKPENEHTAVEVDVYAKSTHSPQAPDNSGSWISVTERLPELQISVIGWGNDWTRPGEVFYGNSEDYGRNEPDLSDGLETPEQAHVQCWRWLNDGMPIRNNNVTHWMPLPAPPQQ